MRTYQVIYVIEDEVKMIQIRADQYKIKRFDEAHFYVGNREVAWFEETRAIWEVTE